MNNKKFLIHIEIADKTYPLWIFRDEEERTRKAAKQIKALLEQYRTKYPVSSNDNPKYAEGNRDWLAMAALQLSIRSLEMEERNDTTPFVEKIQQMTNLLEAYLEEQK
ncbi:MAG: cell division protein ZapA [Tannerellaceae bacterium]|jgi:cell division protein ZapA|nr:cell division protein ZapA [Tannerellaceae bacterium]